MGERREIPEYMDRRLRKIAEMLGADEETVNYLYCNMVKHFKYQRKIDGREISATIWAIGRTIYDMIIEEEKIKDFLNNRAKWEAEAEKLLAKT